MNRARDYQYLSAAKISRQDGRHRVTRRRYYFPFGTSKHIP